MRIVVAPRAGFVPLESELTDEFQAALEFA